MFQSRHIKIYHSTWQSHCHRFTKAFTVAVHLTLANDLRVFLSWTPMKMSTTYRHTSFFRICGSLCAVEITSHWQHDHALKLQDITKDPEDPTLLLHP